VGDQVACDQALEVIKFKEEDTKFVEQVLSDFGE